MALLWEQVGIGKQRTFVRLTPDLCSVLFEFWPEYVHKELLTDVDTSVDWHNRIDLIIPYQLQLLERLLWFGLFRYILWLQSRAFRFLRFVHLAIIDHDFPLRQPILCTHLSWVPCADFFCAFTWEFSPSSNLTLWALVHHVCSFMLFVFLTFIKCVFAFAEAFSIRFLAFVLAVFPVDKVEV